MRKVEKLEPKWVNIWATIAITSVECRGCARLPFGRSFYTFLLKSRRCSTKKNHRISWNGHQIQGFRPFRWSSREPSKALQKDASNPSKNKLKSASKRVEKHARTRPSNKRREKLKKAPKMVPGGLPESSLRARKGVKTGLKPCWKWTLASGPPSGHQKAPKREPKWSQNGAELDPKIGRAEDFQRWCPGTKHQKKSQSQAQH